MNGPREPLLDVVQGNYGSLRQNGAELNELSHLIGRPAALLLQESQSIGYFISGYNEPFHLRYRMSPQASVFIRKELPYTQLDLAIYCYPGYLLELRTPSRLRETPT